MGERRAVPDSAAIALVWALVGGLTLLDLHVIFLSSADIEPVWEWLQVPVLVCGWVAVWAWHRSRWMLAAIALLPTLIGLWGYLYLGPLVGIGLALAAFNRARREDQ